MKNHFTSFSFSNPHHNQSTSNNLSQNHILNPQPIISTPYNNQNQASTPQLTLLQCLLALTKENNVTKAPQPNAIQMLLNQINARNHAIPSPEIIKPKPIIPIALRPQNSTNESTMRSENASHEGSDMNDEHHGNKIIFKKSDLNL
mmetsp:Transcript_11552/g.10019  ORF Transcript_11552/g.10019 Transcript_11552/m.10019 type:complete len:146 (-) Transcript_11552:688-1125(-)